MGTLIFLLLLGFGGEEPPAHYVSNGSHFRHLVYIPKPHQDENWTFSASMTKDQTTMELDPRDRSKHNYSAFLTLTGKLNNGYLSAYTGWGNGKATLIRGNNPPFEYEFKSFHAGMEWGWEPKLTNTRLSIYPIQIRLGFTKEKGEYREHVELMKRSNYLKGRVEDIDPGGLTYQYSLSTELYYSLYRNIGIGVEGGATRESGKWITYATTYAEVAHVGVTVQFLNPIEAFEPGLQRLIFGGYIRF